MSRAPLSPLSAVIAHAESLLDRSRVLFVGSALSSVPFSLLERGARLCHVLDPDPRRVAQAAQQLADRRVTYSQLSDVALRENSYDVAVVLELGDHERPEDLLERVRPALGNQGVVIINAANTEQSSGLLGSRPGTVGYTAFVSVVRRVFERAIFMAQTPFVGYAVVALELDEAPLPAMDNGFLDGRADVADSYVAFAGSAEALANLELEEMSVVQLPALPALALGREGLEASLTRATRRVQALEEELTETRRAQPVASERDRSREEIRSRDDAPFEQARAEQARAKAQLTARLAEREQELGALRQEFEALQGEKQAWTAASMTDEMVELRERADSVERELERLKKDRKWADDRVRRLERELEEAVLAQEELDKAQERIATLQGHLKDSEDEVDLLTEKVQDLEETLRELEATAQARGAEEEVVRLEQQLEERGVRVRELEAQLEDLTIFAKTLVAEKRHLAPPSELSEEKGRIEALSLALAEKEADLVAARWTIQSLEQRGVGSTLSVSDQWGDAGSGQVVGAGGETSGDDSMESASSPQDESWS